MRRRSSPKTCSRRSYVSGDIAHDWAALWLGGSPPASGGSLVVTLAGRTEKLVRRLESDGPETIIGMSRRLDPSALAPQLPGMEFRTERAGPGVELHPASGRNPTKDYWVALMPELGLQHVDLGIDAALMGLAECASEAAIDRLANEDFDSNSLHVLLRLRSARQTGRLGELVRSCARLHCWDCEETSADAAK